MDKTSGLFVLVIAFYFIQALFSIFYSGIAPLPDLIAVIIILFLFLIINIKFVRFDKMVPVVLGIGFFPHIIGLYRIIPYNKYYVGTLYGAPQLLNHYDWFVHSFSCLCFTFVFLLIFYEYLIKGLKSRWLVFFIALFFIMGVGCLNEIMEYAGYRILGYGEGFLEFGEGDVASNSGPWANASVDMFNNMWGAALGIGIFFVYVKRFCKRKTI